MNQVAALDGVQAKVALRSAQQASELAQIASSEAVAACKTTAELYADAAGPELQDGLC